MYFLTHLRNRSLDLLAIITILSVASNPATAGTGLCDPINTIKFAKNTSRAVVQNAIARGEIACWSFIAREGQKLVIAVQSPRNKSALVMYKPGWKVLRDGDDLTIDGEAYPGVADGDDAVEWQGRVAKSGQHLVTIGATSGGSAYTLKLSIEP